MKTKFLYQITILLFLITLVSCQSEETNPNTFPAIGETNGNYIACKLDGEEYISMAFESYTTQKMIGTLITENGKSLYGFVNFYKDNKRAARINLNLLEFPIINKTIKLTKTSELNSLEDSCRAYFDFGFSGPIVIIDTITLPGVSDFYISNSVQIFQTTDYEIGEIKFTLVDTIDQIYQGTFWADLKFHKWDTKGYPNPWPNTEDYWNLVAQRTNIDTNKIIRVRDGRFYFNAAKPDLRIDRR